MIYMSSETCIMCGVELSAALISVGIDICGPCRGVVPVKAGKPRRRRRGSRPSRQPSSHSCGAGN